VLKTDKLFYHFKPYLKLAQELHLAFFRRKRGLYRKRETRKKRFFNSRVDTEALALGQLLADTV